VRITNKQFTHDTAFHGIKIYGTREELRDIYNKKMRSKIFLSTNIAGMANKPNEDGEFWITGMIWNRDLEKVLALLSPDCKNTGDKIKTNEEYMDLVVSIAKEAIGQESPSSYALESVGASEWTFKTPLMNQLMEKRHDDQKDLETAYVNNLVCFGLYD